MDTTTSADVHVPDTDLSPDSFVLNVRLVGSGPVMGAESTSDNCGSGNTGSSACTTNC